MRRKIDVLQQKEGILNTAMEVFAKKGYAATKLEDIAAAQGISRGPLYYHYSNKHDLFVATLDNFFAAHNSMLKEIFSTGEDIFSQIRADYRFCFWDINISSTLVNHDVEENLGDDEDIIAQITAYRHAEWNIKKAAVETAIRNGILKPDTDADEFINMTITLFYGLSNSRFLPVAKDTKLSPEFMENQIELLVHLLECRYANR